ncbi:MAG: GGDEF domain-containing protein [Erythrobacter sp.]
MASQEFGIQPERDAEWERECWRETVKSVLHVEKHAFPTNLLAIIAIAVAASFLPNARAFVLPVAMRLLAAVGTHLTYSNLRSAMDLGKSLKPRLRILGIMLFFGGMSWGYLLVPLIVEPYLHPLRLVIDGGVLVGTALVISMTAPLRLQTLAFAVGFLTTMALGLSLAPPGDFVLLFVGFSVLLAGVATYSFATMKQRQLSAEMLVENRRLNEELAEALAQAEFLARHDPLTGLYNRRALFESDLAHHGKSRKFQLLLIDLDNFKQLNDSYGHDAGDRMLIAASGLMRDAMRGYSDANHFAVRLGGEEFALFLDEADDEQTHIFAEDLREAISCLHDELGLPAGATSASIGISHHICGEPIEQAVGRADKAMYDAKSDGRNRVRRNTR